MVDPTERPSAENYLFDHFLRTGRRLTGTAARHLLEAKFNPNHNPDDGRFTYGPGGGSLESRSRIALGIRAIPKYGKRPSERDDPIGAIIWDSVNPKRENNPSAAQSKPSKPDPIASSGKPAWHKKNASVRIPSRLVPKIDAVSSDFHKKTGKALTVTDGARSPEDQAVRMYNKYRLGDFHTYTGTAGRKVEAAYRKAIVNSARQSIVIAQMASVIRSELASGRPVSKHLLGRGADFSLRGMTSADVRLLMGLIRKHGGSPLYEDTPRHIHGSFGD